MNKTHALMLCAALGLSACGGGDDDNTPAAPPVTEQVPADVSVSVTSLLTYLKALVASSADTLEPVDVTVVTPATDDTGEPSPID